MRTLKLKTDGSAVTTIKQITLIMALLITFLPSLLIYWGDLTVAPELSKILSNMFITGISLLMAYSTIMILLSAYSPIKILGIRKKLINFTRLFIDCKTYGLLFHSVKWRYVVQDKKIIIELYPNGLVKDTAEIGKKLSQYLDENLLKYKESDKKACYIFGKSPERYDGIKLLGEGITKLTGGYKPKISYKPIPIFDNITWDYNSEALHMLLIAPSGAGKTMFLNYLGGMVLRRQHMLYVIDAKNSQFGKLYKHIGVQVAATTKEIIDLLTALVQEMEERYSKYFAVDNIDIDANFATLGLKGHFIIFDEILSALEQAGREEKAEIVRLLGQLALKGRAAGISLVITSQKLNATDLPKSITEQCQTRIILGALVSEETFHQATNLYRKEIVTEYKGDVGKGYAITPKSEGLTYIETPLMPSKSNNYKVLLKELRDRGTPYGEGR